MFEILVVAAASGLAGFVDAIVGGGGLVLVPALFATYPGTPPATLFGINKGAAIWGTGWAAGQYLRRVSLSVRSLWPAVLVAGAGSLAGAWTVGHLDATLLRRALPLVLLALLAYTLARKDLGRQHAPRFAGRAETAAACAVGAAVGFYDGLFGPGTGSFFVFLFVRWLGYDFLHASAAAKLLNTATNAAALALFASKGQVWWHLAAVLALANIAGSLLGTRLALKHGAGFVRGMFVLVVAALILKTGWDALRL
jgi:uncharacterized membrane protein YfcA